MEEALFSAKCFAAAMLAFYIALRIGLPRPYWAITSSYIVAQARAGAVLSKALFRLIGTGLGAFATVVLVPIFVNQPLILSLALAVWLGACLYISLLDRTPRAYIFLLAGFTASIIGFPSVDAPGDIFNTASLRVQEIAVGILTASLIHGVVFPRTLTDLVLQKLDALIEEAERWSCNALSPLPGQANGLERQIATALTELEQLVLQLPFDVARILPQRRSLRAIQDRLLQVLPLGSAVADRLRALEQVGGPSKDVSTSGAQTLAWLRAGVKEAARGGTAGALINGLSPGLTAPKSPTWRQLLELNLQARLAELITVHRDIRDLRERINGHSRVPADDHISRLLTNSGPRAAHRDFGLAFRAAVGSMISVCATCAFWIVTAWPDGASAAMWVAICCTLFANIDNPAPLVVRTLFGNGVGFLFAILYAFAILPRITTFETYAASVAPFLLFFGSVLARPPLFLFALQAILGFSNIVGFSASYNQDFAAFSNSAMAQLAGCGIAVFGVLLFQTIEAHHSIARILRAA